jgi:hypothetical protein
MENERGEVVQNEYEYSNVEIGFVPAGKTQEEWIAMLRSARKSDVLAALVFLGGNHITDGRRGTTAESAAGSDASLFKKLVVDERIRGLVKRLSRSDDEWVRQAAELAARGFGESPLRR